MKLSGFDFDRFSKPGRGSMSASPPFGIQGAESLGRDNEWDATWDLYNEAKRVPSLKEALKEAVGDEPPPNPNGETGLGGSPIWPFKNLKKDLEEKLSIKPELAPILTGINPWLDREIGIMMSKMTTNPTITKEIGA